MRKRFFPAWLLTAAAGCTLHFLYDLWPVRLAGFIAPVNESVWEHLKLLYWPFLAAAFLMNRKSRNRRHSWNGYLLALVLMPLLLLGGHYTLSAGFGLEATWMDISLYFLALAIGFAVAFHLEKAHIRPWITGVWILAVGIYGAALVLFTLAPPYYPIFMEF